ncbi:serine hydrolase domain-containing protein [Altererythrobacter sp.]|uniref:serine hydrolase domain-containing protein n=1 Tax=Altererythrobacter sp. TaxID=1872480 RepID=UPI003D002ECB
MAFREFDSVQVSRRSLFRSTAYLAAGGAIATLPFGAELLARVETSAWPNLASTIDSYVSAGKVANMVAVIGSGQDSPQKIAQGGQGFGRSSAPAGLDTLYRIYSMTKPITGMAAMICIEDGLMSLDQPVADFLPGFANMRVLKQADGPLDQTVPAERPITIRNLLTHTAGLGYDIITKGPLLKAYQASGIVGGQVSRIPIPGFTNAKPAPGLKVWADRLAKLPLIAQPGAKWSYSVGLDLMGRVIEVATGQTLDAFLQQRIFEPCGMDSSWFQVPESEAHRLSDNYGILNGVPLPIDVASSSVYLDKPPIIWGGSGLVCSPRDYDRFLEMVLGYGKINGRRVMSETAVRVGTSNILPEGADLSGSFVAGQGFGAGARVADGTYGWGGAAGTLGMADFGNGIRAGLFTQFMPAEAYPVTRDFRAALIKDLQVRAHG